MKILKYYMIGFITCVFMLSCTKESATPSMEVTGVIKKQGITTYQYGTHTISGFAHKSKMITLDNFVNQEVTIVGNKIDGYPIDGGPEYLEVIEIR